LTTFALCDPRSAGPTEENEDVLELAALLHRARTKQAAPPSPEIRKKRLRVVVLRAVPASGGARRDLRVYFRLTRGEDFTLPPTRLSGGIVLRRAVPRDYLQRRDSDPHDAAPYWDEATRRASARDVDGAVRVLSSLLELRPRGESVRQVGYRLLALEKPALAARLLAAQVMRDPEEPANHRALAVSLSRSGRPVWAALHYEAALAQLGENKAGQSAVTAEYAALLSAAGDDDQLSTAVRTRFRARLEEIDPTPGQADLRVTATWSTPGAAVDLVVAGPDGKRTVALAPKGVVGRLGPSCYELPKASAGVCVIEVRLRRKLPGEAVETCVFVEVVRQASGAREQRRRYTILLRRAGETKAVAKVKF
jgi:hypothetical protein